MMCYMEKISYWLIAEKTVYLMSVLSLIVKYRFISLNKLINLFMVPVSN